MFEEGFPAELLLDVLYVSSVMPNKTFHNTSMGYTQTHITCRLLNDEEIRFPYRIYYVEPGLREVERFTYTQKIIYHCLYSRSSDGFIREKHIKELLSETLPEWVIPYVFKVCDEYVIEILECVYSKIPTQNISKIKLWCVKNPQLFLRGRDRMISYWNEYYKTKNSKYTDYVGYKLFEQYFGFHR